MASPPCRRTASPQYARCAAPLAIDSPGTESGVLDLDGTFGLHPVAHELARDVSRHRAARAARRCNAVSRALALRCAERARGRRRDPAPRATAAGSTARSPRLPPAATRARAVALADSVPLVLRGELAVSSWAPSRLPDADEDTLARVRRLYEAADPELAASLNEALEAREIAGDAGETQRMAGRGGQQIAPLASAAARFSGSADGPRIAVLDAGGWDTHANQGAAQGTLALRLRGLDAGFADAEDRARRALARDDGARRHGVRPHGRRQRHARHGSRHGRLRVPRRRSRRGRPRDRATGQASPRAICTRAATCARRSICAACSRRCSRSNSASRKAC